MTDINDPNEIKDPRSWEALEPIIVGIGYLALLFVTELTIALLYGFVVNQLWHWFVWRTYQAPGIFAMAGIYYMARLLTVQPEYGPIDLKKALVFDLVRPIGILFFGFCLSFFV